MNYFGLKIALAKLLQITFAAMKLTLVEDPLDKFVLKG